MSNVSKGLLLLGAIGGFLVGILVTPGVAEVLGFIEYRDWWILPQGLITMYSLITLGGILIGIGFLGLWRKSGNSIPLVSAILIFLMDIGFLYSEMWTFLPYPWLYPDPSSPVINAIVSTSMGVAWFSAGISAWILREQLSRFAIVTALALVVAAAESLEKGLLFGFLTYDPLFIWLMALTGIVVGIFFLDAIRIET
ncbi:MAG: hypothetical protein JSW05_00245 [Candidatus Thorarchaeota archaeon]|nr:MAG: hypothetical protein JSW05_00245 [Candidatus Thorarchaeota archaeon]